MRRWGGWRGSSGRGRGLGRRSKTPRRGDARERASRWGGRVRPEPGAREGFDAASGAPGRRRTSSGGACPRPASSAAPRRRSSGARRRAGGGRCTPCCGSDGKSARTGEGDVSCRRRRGDAARGAEASARGGARGRPSPRKRARRSAPPARREDARGRARAGAGREGSAERGVGGGVCESGGAIERRGSRVRRTHLHCGDDDSWSPPWAAPSCFRAPNIVAKRFRGRVLPPAPVSGLHRPGEWTRALARQRTLSGRKTARASASIEPSRA